MSHLASASGLVAASHAKWAHVLHVPHHMGKPLPPEGEDWMEAQGNEGTWGQREFTEGEQISEQGHHYAAGGTDKVEEAEYFFKGAGCKAWEKSQKWK